MSAKQPDEAFASADPEVILAAGDEQYAPVSMDTERDRARP